MKVADICVRLSEIIQTVEILERAALAGDTEADAMAGPLALVARDLRAAMDQLDAIDHPRLKAVQS